MDDLCICSIQMHEDRHTILFGLGDRSVPVKRQGCYLDFFHVTCQHHACLHLAGPESALRQHMIE
uniref:Uncharacterized protein n=1 Tax=Oryza brachyantha TaxID=4533 RepID=J3MT88_ORYBR